LLHCRDVAALATEYAEGNLSTGRRLALRFHLLVCRGCRAFVAQLERTRALLGRLGNGAASASDDAELLGIVRGAPPKG
jgi:anti-sigma factor ChrR (cupin superfamily)